MSARSRIGWRRALIPSSLAVLALTLLAAAPTSPYAEDLTIDAQPLREAIKAGKRQPVRFVLSNGKTVIGRVVTVGEDALTIRRPSAGLRSLPFAEIASVNIKMKSGDLMRGQITRMADGTIGWLADGTARPKPETELTDAKPEALSESGGPLIPLLDLAIQPEDGEVGATRDEGEIAAETIAVKPADVVTPKLVTPAKVEPIRLTETADEASESDKLIYFRLTLSEPAPQSVLIIYTMLNGTAVAPGDYTHRQGVVVFKPGETQAVVATSIVNDDVAEGAESFAFFVTGDPATVSIEERKIAATINDDDSG